MQENTSPIYTEFLPISRADMEARGWDQLDFVVVGGDAYVDHPSFGTAIISRLLEAEGYKVGVLAQPRYTDCEDFKRFGKPKYGFFIGGGNVDSMVSHYSVAKIPRAEDEYSPGGKAGARPDRSATVYTKLAKQAYPDLPVILGGLEASLRRFAHYDYWLDTVLPSIAEDSGADLISFGMGEHQTVEIARRLAAGEPVELKRLSQALGCETGEVQEAANRLMDRLGFERRGVRVVRLDGAYQMCSAGEMGDFVARALETRKPPKLSASQLETLTVIAYYQPATKAMVEQIRGVDSSYSVTALLNKKLIEECGRLNVPGRPLQYRTTPDFLRTFGLASLEELPELELAELGTPDQLTLEEAAPARQETAP
mgnify:FL=1